jgi:ribosomal protein L29
MTYEKDFYAWTFEQAQKLRAGEPIDTENVAEEIESLGKSIEQELYNRVAVLMAHLLKCEFQADRKTRSWDLTIKEQRRRIARLLAKNPSVRPKVAQVVIDAYSTAVFLAAHETGIIEQDFPERCPYAVEEVLTDLT